MSSPTSRRPGVEGAAPGDPAASGGPAEGCFCITLDRSQLQERLRSELGDALAERALSGGWATAFAELPVFVPEPALRRMRQAVEAIERVVALPGWREHSLHSAPEAARHDPQGARGAFLGYDFHISGSRLGLIEINTNAGGALMNALLARAQRACCSVLLPMQPTSAAAEELERRIVAMFQREWHAGHAGEPLRRVAIVDSDPPSQYLYPEFLLFQRLFQRHGIETVIASPEQLSFTDGRLRLGEVAIDLVYNRLTDFYFEQPSSKFLRDAYLTNAVVVTPHPQAHALYANKERLVDLSDHQTLEQFGAAAEDRALLAEVVPRTDRVRAANADDLWSRRRELFFKPVSGFGARGAFRGDKLTRRTWEDILRGGYVAQALVQPGVRHTARSEGDAPMKFDVRQYVYAAQVQWTGARMYRGQTTNFRTPGGGFAPVYTLPQADASIAHALKDAVSRDDSEYASYVFLLGADGVHPIPHALYVALARSEAASDELAGRAFRLADWHVRLEHGAPADIVREWYGWVRFDEGGKFEPTGSPAKSSGDAASGIANVDRSALPGPAELQAMRAAVFGGRDAERSP
ncbi:hypothetical protein WG922_15815 [Ramlibacter sp. AN1015]|uniref:hypothetical protein n=1 Tax=Ramlibacter sp. AN1015 TaxID=3133428 RepID=UPI0030C2CA02